MRSRTAVLTAVAVALAATTPAVAAVKKAPPKVCNLLVDEKGDGDWDMAPVSSDRLDVLGADIATGKTEFVAVLRLANTKLEGDNYANLGYSWYIQALGNAVKYTFNVRKPSGSSTKLTSTATIGGNAVEHTFAVVGNTYVWKFKRTAAGNVMTRPKMVWTDFTAGSAVLSSTADTAGVSKKKYADKAPSCVVAK